MFLGMELGARGGIFQCLRGACHHRRCTQVRRGLSTPGPSWWKGQTAIMCAGASLDCHRTCSSPHAPLAGRGDPRSGGNGGGLPTQTRMVARAGLFTADLFDTPGFHRRAYDILADMAAGRGAAGEPSAEREEGGTGDDASP